MYKDKAKQREANRLANKRYRARRKGITVDKGITPVKVTHNVIPKQSHNPMMVGYVPPKE